jgi:hypothetical protein
MLGELIETVSEKKNLALLASDPRSFPAGPMGDLVRVEDRMVGAVRGPERPNDAPPAAQAAP